LYEAYNPLASYILQIIKPGTIILVLGHFCLSS